MKRVRLLGLIALLVLAIVVGGAYAHARAQLPTLRGRTPYPSPAEAMRAVITGSYTGLQKMEILRSGPDMPLAGNLWFVEARVWANGRRDGKTVLAGDNPGCFFLHLSQGWVFVPESQHPELLAISLRLFGDQFT